MNLLLFVLASCGIANIIVYGKIFDKPRQLIKPHFPAIECFQCIGGWSGLTTGYVLLDGNIAGTLMAAFAGSFLSEYAETLRVFIEAHTPQNEG